MPDQLINRSEVLHRQAAKLFAEDQRLRVELERIYVKLERLREAPPPVKNYVVVQGSSIH